MSGQRSDVHIHFIHIERDLAGRLNRVRVEKYASLPRDFPDFLHVLNNADLVVGRHDRDQNRLIRDRPFQIVQIDETLAVDRQKRDVETILFKMLAGVENRFVFRDARDDVIAFLAIHPCDAFHRQIVGFRRATREDDLARIGADQCGDFFACRLDGLFRFPAELVIAACGIAEMIREIRHHGIKHARIERSRRVIVHVNRQLNHFLPVTS